MKKKKLRKIQTIFGIENWLWKSRGWVILHFLDTSPLTQFSKFDNFLWVCWFLGENLSNFVPPVWKLHNAYCHNTHSHTNLIIDNLLILFLCFTYNRCNRYFNRHNFNLTFFYYDLWLLLSINRDTIVSCCYCCFFSLFRFWWSLRGVNKKDLFNQGWTYNGGPGGLWTKSL